MTRLTTPNQVPEMAKIGYTARAANPMRSLDSAIQRIFTSPQEETRLLRARRIMGSSVKDLADEELEVYLTEIQYLLDEWLNEFEQHLFDGLTLKQVLGQD